MKVLRKELSGSTDGMQPKLYLETITLELKQVKEMHGKANHTAYSFYTYTVGLILHCFAFCDIIYTCAKWLYNVTRQGVKTAI